MKRNAVPQPATRDVVGQRVDCGRSNFPAHSKEGIPICEKTTSVALPMSVAKPEQSHGSLVAEVEAKPSSRQSRVWSPRRNRRSTSFLCSIALHLAGLLLLLLILAPADFGGTGTQTIFVSLDQSEPIQELFVLAPSSSDVLQGGATVDAPQGGMLSHSMLRGFGSFSNGATRGQAGSARGSFFGIEAGGHEFVYVLDMSGSMEGRRFDRARDELMRSVKQLGPHQSFYVLLFSSGTLQLFDQDDFLPEPVAATPENKERLGKWLTKAFQGGGTDPREALRVAMRMKPSAIFMLSDGEFNGNTQQKSDKLVGGNGDAFSIVGAASTITPIHSIAFEDRRSRANMKRLADMTDGEFRFVPLDDGIAPAVSLQSARIALQKGSTADAEEFLRKAVANLAGDESEEATKLKVDVANVLLELAKNGLENGKVDATRMALSESVRMDESATIVGEAQNWLVEKLLAKLREDAQDKELQDTLAFMPTFLEQFPNSAVANQIRDPLALIYLQKARQLDRSGDTHQAIQHLEFVMTKLYGTKLLGDCKLEHKRIGEGLIQHAGEIQQQHGDVAAVQYLYQLDEDFRDTLLHRSVTQALEGQARAMLVAARDAGIEGDTKKQIEFQRAIASVFGDARLLKKVRDELVAEERRAQVIMRTAFRLEQSSWMAAAEKYRKLVQDYSGTMAAKMAEERLRFVGR